MILAARGVVAGTLTVGDVVLVNTFLLQLYQPLNFLGVVYRQVKQSLTDLESLMGLLDLEPEIKDRPGARAARGSRGGEVRFEEVDLWLRPAPAILHDLSFTIPAGPDAGRGRQLGRRQIDAGPPAVPLLRDRRGRILIDGQDLRDVTQASPRAPRSVSCPRTPCCSTTRSAPTSPTAARAPAGRDRGGRRARPRSTTSSIGLPDGYGPWSASAASSCPAARSSGSRSRAWC